MITDLFIEYTVCTACVCSYFGKKQQQQQSRSRVPSINVLDIFFKGQDTR